MPEEARKTYLVEQYRPGLAVDGLVRTANDVRASAGELARQGKPVRFLHSAVIPGDEALLCFLEAASLDLVRETYERAGVPFDRISAAMPDDE
jgi:Nickel responsive protein SCO4226-like